MVRNIILKRVKYNGRNTFILNNGTKISENKAIDMVKEGIIVNATIYRNVYNREYVRAKNGYNIKT